MTDEIAVQEAEVVPLAGESPSEDDAPFGWMTDPVTGERRPKKRPGRRSKAARVPTGKTPAVEELQALGSLSEASEDAPPGSAPKLGRRKTPKPAEPLPPFRAGVIAKGMNGLYRRAGRIIRIWDMDIGSAVIACTRSEDEDEPTVGEAWENLAKTNPRIRAFLLKLLTGGAWTGVFMAHLPIFMAIAMKDGIRERLPLPRLADAFLSDEDEDGGQVASPLSQMMGGVGPDDMAQMIAMAQGLMGQMANGVPRQPNLPREPVASHPADPVQGVQVAGIGHPADQG